MRQASPQKDGLCSKLRPSSWSPSLFTKFFAVFSDHRRQQTIFQGRDYYDRHAGPPRFAPQQNIPEPRPAMISGFPIPVLATARPKREYPDSMQSKADVDGSGFLHFDQRRQLAALRAGRISSRAQATFHTIPDHEGKSANRAMDRITMPSALLARRLRSSLWCQKQVVIGHRGR